MSFLRVLFISFAILYVSSSFAIVDMRNANYSETWTDLISKNSGFDLRVQRTYNSRTLYSGMLGFGWCTDFETSLKVTPENSLRITECGAGFEIEYLPKNVKDESINQTVDQIISEVKKRNKNRPAEYFTKLADDIRRDTILRDEFTKQLNIKGTVKEGTRYEADGRTVDYMTYQNGDYTRHLANGTFQRFNKQGELTRMGDKNGNFINIAYKNNRIISATDNTGASLQFKYKDKNKFVDAVIGPKGMSAQYKHDGENLVGVVDAQNGRHSYEYDDLYNMTKAVYPDKTTVVLTYQKDKDWVMSFKDRRNCKETYDYKESKKDPMNNYSSSVSKVCDGKVTNKSEFEFWHKTKNDGRRYLAKTKAVVNGLTTETEYHDVYGRPVEIRENGMVTKFEYYNNGQLMKKMDPNSTYNYSYETVCNKVSEVKVAIRVPKSVSGERAPSKTKSKTAEFTTRLFQTEFRYDPKRCNLMTAKNNSGQAVQLSYDVQGRISKIFDQSKKSVIITYESRFGKPDVVNRPGLGKIKFRYNSDGTMKDFDSDDDPIVASQVLNIFSNLLEIIGPATTETNNI